MPYEINDYIILLYFFLNLFRYTKNVSFKDFLKKGFASIYYYRIFGNSVMPELWRLFPLGRYKTCTFMYSVV